MPAAWASTSSSPTTTPLPPELPSAQAVVNPCFLPSTHPAHAARRGLCLPAGRGPQRRPGRLRCERSLDLLALAIVADVATLQGDARYYLQRGSALRATERLGLAALYETAGLACEASTKST